ncbi:unnamed protein product [Vitrella brassicaformis CCMP3155]|uniref:Trimethylguanosine synthase n=1 Tax=Vitrella brassicaformis (strain CCMP3155) TaxID=1169540 RepID=A0A0G4G5X2_VITBC|nr:unnamed protein product [Vitrella brassicaformis CCMP3155]|eukprot:CEM23924.1 unnamed protein product [Vitrella brassicaformis CCMP3155]
MPSRSVPAKSTPTHVDDAQENFKLYGVTPARICKESFYAFVDRTKQRKHRCDLVFADLPWGGAAFVKGQRTFDITKMGYEVGVRCAELGAWKATRELYENGHELVSYRPPVIDAYLTRLLARRGGGFNYKLKYITAYIGNIAERYHFEEAAPPTITWCPAHTTVEDRVMSLVDSGARRVSSCQAPQRPIIATYILYYVAHFFNCSPPDRSSRLM